MGEMILRNLDDALLVELQEHAQRRGVSADVLAVDLLRLGLRGPKRDRAAEARAIQALQRPRPDLDSAQLIRRDRDER